jgi:hypothetical protein
MAQRMDVQQLIVMLIVLGAVVFIARRVWSAVMSARASKHGGCASGCGCETTPAASASKKTLT